MNLRLIATMACLALAIAGPARAEQPAKTLFTVADPIHIVIQAPLSTIIRKRESEGRIAGTLTDPAGQSLPVSLALRGITRRTSEVCDFPPLRVDFTAPPAATSAFAGQSKLKLVTHCRNSQSFQQYVLLEYAAYRMFNLLSPRSFRVRLANIDYRDGDGRPIASRVGFFIEDLGDVARRNDTRETHGGERIPVADLNPADAARYALFQHMIANHDWSMRAGPPGDDCCHNAKLIGALGPGSVTPIPYDFDFSGFVNAPYATAPSELDIADVRQRFYRGYCMHNQYVVAAAREMRALHPQIIGVLGQVPGLEPATRQRAGAYLEKFFTDIGTDADVGSKVLNRCLN
ncbi:MAG: hypothetical protein ABI454_12390 [Sphingomicrobium sp.]